MLFNVKEWELAVIGVFGVLFVVLTLLQELIDKAKIIYGKIRDFRQR